MDVTYYLGTIITVTSHKDKEDHANVEATRRSQDSDASETGM